MTTPEPDRELPHVLADRLRQCGATQAELDRLWDEHTKLDYYHRFLANQQVPTDDASVYALLMLSRDRWATEGASSDEPDEPKTGPAATEDAATEGAATDPEPPSPQPVQTKLEVPAYATTVAQVLAWVKSDKAKAQAALDAELTSGDVRTSLVRDLRKILEG
jgi:hypothetical protein